MTRVVRIAVLAVVVLGAACSNDQPAATDERATTAEVVVTADSEQRFPDVIDATATVTDAGWTIAATLSSPYDSPERYADAWRVLDPDGNVLGVRELLHDHAGEQPFTRSLTGVEIPDDVEEITIEGRDQEHGWGGDTVTIALARTP